MGKFFVMLVLCTFSLLIAGCNGGGGEKSDSTKKDDSTSQTETKDPGPAPKGQTEPEIEQELTPETVSLKVTDWDGVEEMVKASAGKVVVIDLWATTCLPCRREFPNLIKLHEAHKEDVVCISVSCDYLGLEEAAVESYETRVKKFLAKNGADFQNVLLNTPQPDFFEAISLKGIPAIYVYDQQGKLQKRFDNDTEFAETGFSYEDQVIPLVAKLIKK